MNILVDTLPDFITVRDKKYKINTSHKVWISFEEIMTNDNIPLWDKYIKIISLCLKDRTLPPSLEETIKELFNFYAISPSAPTEKNSKKLLDFSYDGDLIYSAFLSQYGIDLNQTPIHWWKFISLFKGLTPDNRICEVMQIRNINPSKIQDKEQRAMLSKLQRQFRIPSTEPDNDIGAEFGKLM
ncbi:MAG: hypothetical protein J6C17_03650 [Clostridia bacterium]|nr:hypothetical protein [Clostridia bacterium]